MKKSIVVSCILTVLLLSGCSTVRKELEKAQKTAEAPVGSNTVIANVASETITTTAKEVVESSTEDPLPGFMGNSQITIENFEKGINDHGENILVITYNFRNLTVEPLALMDTDLDIDVFQNGIELQEAVISEQIPSNIECDLSNDTKKILPGYSISCQRAYILSESSTNVKVFVTRFFNDFYKLEYDIEIQRILGKAVAFQSIVR